MATPTFYSYFASILLSPSSNPFSSKPAGHNPAADCTNRPVQRSEKGCISSHSPFQEAHPSSQQISSCHTVLSDPFIQRRFAFSSKLAETTFPEDQDYNLHQVISPYATLPFRSSACTTRCPHPEHLVGMQRINAHPEKRFDLTLFIKSCAEQSSRIILSGLDTPSVS